MLLVQLKPADVTCGKATLRTSPSSGQAAFSSRLGHLELSAYHSRAAFEGSQPCYTCLRKYNHLRANRVAILALTARYIQQGRSILRKLYVSASAPPRPSAQHSFVIQSTHLLRIRLECNMFGL